MEKLLELFKKKEIYLITKKVQLKNLMGPMFVLSQIKKFLKQEKQVILIKRYVKI